ncbi:hypothetical protein [Streptomyces mirabilis]|uniref:hypothetical protein n=1 Tax=Streptomyces mirabilis TaxID=68239 RepID=UPI0036CE8276
MPPYGGGASALCGVGKFAFSERHRRFTHPGLYDSRLFEVVDGRIPPHWVISVKTRGEITLGPSGWGAPGFWDAFFDGEPWATTLYQSEKNKSLALKNFYGYNRIIEKDKFLVWIK